MSKFSRSGHSLSRKIIRDYKWKHNPCQKDCPDRYPGCSSKCEKWAAHLADVKAFEKSDLIKKVRAAENAEIYDRARARKAKDEWERRNG